MTLFLPDFHVFPAILAPNYRICAMIPRFRISHLALMFNLFQFCYGEVFLEWTARKSKDRETGLE